MAGDSNELKLPTKLGVHLASEQLKTYKDFKEPDYVAEPITYSEFFLKYLLPNKLCIIGPWLTNDWLSRKMWVTTENQLNREYLIQEFGDATCPIANCKKEECGSHVKSEMKFSDFMEYMQKYKESGYDNEMDCLYLKDWHFVRSFPEYKAYTTPPYFSSDWLNEFWDNRSDSVCDDYRFVYIGPKGSWTPFHSDVLRSYSWSANICGKKKWIFFPPGEEEKLKDVNGHLPYDLLSPDLKDRKRYPDIDKITQRIEVIQNTGEVVFVPSGWYHQVYNLEDTVSINHNWMNGCNIDMCWNFLRSSLAEVKQEISDCREMDGWDKQCQLILKSTSGIDYLEFYRYIELIAENRIKVIGIQLTSTEKIRNILLHQYKKKNPLETFDVGCKVGTAVEEVMSYCQSQSREFIHKPPVVPVELQDRFPMFNCDPEKLHAPVMIQAVTIYSHVLRELRWAYTLCHEHYGWHFPELRAIIANEVTYARVVKLLGNRKNAVELDLSSACSLFSTDLMDQVIFGAGMSMGAEVNNEFIKKSDHLCNEVISIGDYKKQMDEYLQVLMSDTGPITAELVGPTEGAQLLCYVALMHSDNKCEITATQNKVLDKCDNRNRQIDDMCDNTNRQIDDMCDNSNRQIDEDANKHVTKFQNIESRIHQLNLSMVNKTEYADHKEGYKSEYTLKNANSESKQQDGFYDNIQRKDHESQPLQYNQTRPADNIEEHSERTVLNRTNSIPQNKKENLPAESRERKCSKTEPCSHKGDTAILNTKGGNHSNTRKCAVDNDDDDNVDSSSSVENHLLFDLQQLQSLIQTMCNDSDFQDVVKQHCDIMNPCCLYQRIEYCILSFRNK